MAPLFLFILLVPLYLQVISTADLSSEQTVLLSLKQHWNNPSSLESWNPTSSPCNWPEVECTFGAVTGLHLSEKNVSGTIPSAICQLKSLLSINLSKNNISGDIPVSLYNCSNLESLDLSLNFLSGTIPGEFFLMKRLLFLYLHGNRLYGEIPRTIEASSLESLDLSDNQLNGTIPDNIRNLCSLIQLDLSMNALSGTIPMGLFHMRQLYHMSLGYNNLSGPLPEQLDFFSLQVLNLTHNRLYGTIPRSLGELPALSALDLSVNQLSYEFVSREFDENCLDVSNLCSDNRTQGLPSCPSDLCFQYKSQGFLKCNSRHDDSKKHFVIIIVATVGSGIVGFAMLYYLARKCWIKKKHERIVSKTWPSGPPPEDKEEWKVILFQRLKFNKTEILSSLKDENLIGNGGSGKVYQVLINQTGHHVAVKSISNARKSDQRLEKEFLAEVHALGNIRHYNIVKLLCCISGKDLKLLVYQYFENRSLDQWLHRHGDTETASAVAGTFGYIAPEYAYTTKVNTKSDVYSFGVVLLELTTGREAVIEGDHMNLAGWAQLCYRDASAVIDALDAEIKETMYLDQINAVFRLGVICTAASLSNRPSMKDCLHILQNCRNNFSSLSPMTLQLSDYHSLL